MDDWKITKLVRELSINGVISKEKQLELFKLMHEEINSGIKPEESNYRAVLILANQKLIPAIIKHVSHNLTYFNEDSDVYHAAKIAMIEAIDSFDYTRDLTFSTYAYTFVRLKLLHFFQSENRKHKATIISLTEKVDENSNHNYTAIDIPDDYNLCEDVGQKIDADTRRKQIFSQFKHLTEKEQIVFILYFGFFGNKPASGPKIAKKLGVSFSTVNLRLHNGLFKMSLLLKDSQLLTKEELAQLTKIQKKKHTLIPSIKEFFEQEATKTSCL